MRTLRSLITLLLFVTPAPAASEEIATRAEAILRKHCFACHGKEGQKVRGKLKVLDRAVLLDPERKIVVPGKPDESELVKQVEGEMMPPETRPKLSAEDRKALREWVAAGAPAAAAAPAASADAEARRRPLGADYVLQSVLNDVRQLAEADRKSVRYFSLTHLLAGGITKDELAQHRDALARAVNFLSWKRTLVRPVAVEPTHTVFRIDLRSLGWDRALLRKGQESGHSLFDLALLEYPYGVLVPQSAAYQALLREYVGPAGLVRPVPCVRADWFVSVATQPPLYHDFLGLPATLGELERLLGVDAEADVRESRAVRGGVVTSGVSRNNRVVERHAAQYGAHWKSFDFRTSQGPENIFEDPVDLHPAGGEMIFALPNGLHGYFICNGKGERIDAAPTGIVVDANASDRVVRNGLSCMRCHDRGIKTFSDAVRPTLLKASGATAFDRAQALRLYPEQAALDRLLKTDEEAFAAALRRLHGAAPAGEPLRPVSRRYLDEPLGLDVVAAELGRPEARGLEDRFRLPAFARTGLAPLATGEKVHRDAWEADFDRAVRPLRAGVPVVPLDAVTRPNHEPAEAPFELEVRTNKRGNTFDPGEEMVLFVKATRDVSIEVVGTSARGRQVVLVPAGTRIRAGQEFRFPPQGKKVKVPRGAGQEQITVIAAEAPFAGGEVLTAAGAADRMVHPFHVVTTGRGTEVRFALDAEQTVKKTIAVETR
jgi:serine/threonine-protein kinase